jgi:methionine sulfoxide reductase heme-binding subunit
MDIKHRLLKHYLPLLAISLAVAFSLNIIFINPPKPWPGIWNYRVSFSCAYTAFLWIGVSLMTGTWRLIFGRPNPPNDYLRRDIGIWAGIVSCVHGWAGLHVHMAGKMYLYFFRDGQTLMPRTDMFGYANHAGLVALALVIFLTILSNDYWIRQLGLTKWKNLQRLNYLLAGLAIIHTTLYYVMQKNNLAIHYIYYYFASLIIIFQIAGWWIFRRKSRMAAASASGEKARV